VLIVVIVVIVANSGTTPSPTGAKTTSPTTNQVIFPDDFSSQASKWEPYDPEAGRYTNGAYRISAPPSATGGGTGAGPTKASRVSPSAPPNLRIEVEGRRLSTSDQSMGYGVLCRVNRDNGYALTISDDYAKIEKFGAYKILKEAQIRVNPNSTNQLQAVCTSVEGQRAVHLELWVNGQKAVETTDRDSPLPTGTVGLVVGTDKTKRASVAEFDNFVVRL
jgi:hypothetical protein